MIKIKHLVLLLVCAVIAFSSCGKINHDIPVIPDNFDPVVQFTKDTTAIRAFIIAKNIPAIKNPVNGLFYQVIAPGTGSVNYTTSTLVSANYVGTLLNGSVFDKSNGTSLKFELSRVIVGWQIGIPLVQPGGKLRLIIPSGLAYGNDNRQPFPPNSILDFTIDVISAQ
ncbi:FKBP-type peptidyl-prolyl cis-trans isomerase [Pedobacter sp. PAMC26386]|nr:FKBP-type peptidyl-prolyl cis-trans isomerase [Pedobacter sp. PAMC26386]